MRKNSTMVQPSRRALLGLLVLLLALTACGRPSPNVTAEDGRGVERPSSGIWIPETRDVDPGNDMRRSDDGEPDEDDEQERDDEDGRDTRDRPRRAVPDDEASDDGAADPATAPARSEPRPSSTASPSPDHQAPASSAPRDSSGSGSEGGRDDAVADEEDDEPTEPEVVGDCGSASSGPSPSEEELEAAVDELRAEIERRWPETQAGAWTLEEPTEVHVGFTRAVASRLSELCASFPYPQLLHGVRTELSDAELGELLETVEHDRDELREGRAPDDLPKPIRDTKGRYVAAIEHASNSLIVAVEEPGDALLEAFRTHYNPRLHLIEGEFDEDGEPVADEEA